MNTLYQIMPSFHLSAHKNTATSNAGLFEKTNITVYLLVISTLQPQQTVLNKLPDMRCKH